jgi:uncharacterized protein HemY
MSRAGLNAMRAPMVTLVCSTSAITRDKFASTLQIVVVVVVAVAIFWFQKRIVKKIQKIQKFKKRKKSTFSAALHHDNESMKSMERITITRFELYYNRCPAASTSSMKQINSVSGVVQPHAAS